MGTIIALFAGMGALAALLSIVLLRRNPGRSVPDSADGLQAERDAREQAANTRTEVQGIALGGYTALSSDLFRGKRR
ncbi:hypothetical protein [Streptomyces sp. SID5643]|uniref:hypothetical protein n=1 Tax=Streptomyces sp. SID5643 TaxID=2690307 RepID=UPI00136A186C|nr:hypothetical protein [Streptomyces sp. SID5643]MZF85724.1 hypothetical protein [Streptomyces sp. SID5643]